MKRLFSFLLFFMLLISFSSCNKSAVSLDLYPVPQQVVWGERAWSLDGGFTLTLSHEADKDALRVLSEELKLTDNGIKISLGERDDKAMLALRDLVPEKAEAYYLKVSSQGVVIVGYDESGTFYGVQTFLQLVKDGLLSEVEIIDYPSVPERGMVEGYYGNPYSFTDRASHFKFYGEVKMNTYIYGPKEDPYHGFSTRWREFYPEKESQNIKAIIKEANKNKVKFIWAMHPGVDLKWNEADRIASLNKFEAMYELGVRAFALFFDDISMDKLSAKNQAEYLNYLQENFVDVKGDVSPIIFCPTQYNQAWASGSYLETLGEMLHPDIKVMWTGKKVCSLIDNETMEFINNKIGRKAYIWLNYPVTDYCVDRLLMGPFTTNKDNFSAELSGYTANPMEYAEASKVALFSIAAHLWNMEKFDSEKSWLRSMEVLMPDKAEAFKVFCENNVDAGPSYFNLRMTDESLPFAAEAKEFMSDYKVNVYNEVKSNALKARFDTFITACQELKTSKSNPRMMEEITPWIEVFSLISEKGKILLDMQKSLSLGDSVAFINQYTQVKELEKKHKAIRSRDFEGSLKKPNPKPANEVVALFIANLQKDMLSYYRDNFTYKLDELELLALKEGKYYIKVNGMYLYNARGSAKPSLIEEIDATNPPRQEWVVTFDVLFNRYKIVSEQDGRYINNKGQFGTGEFHVRSHTFNISKKESLFTIQNADFSGNDYIIFEKEGAKLSKNKEAIYEFIEI